MTDFEDQLRRALERVEPSEDFAARVAARARRPAPLVHWRALSAAAIAASLALVATGFELDLRQRERRQGEAARAQLIQAMQITSVQLDKINRKVQGALR